MGAMRRRCALALGTQGGSAHLEFEPAGLGGVADGAGGGTDYLPQHDGAYCGQAAALGRSLPLVVSFTHANKVKSATTRPRG